MLIRFFLMLRAAGVPVSITEFLALLEALSLGTVTFAGLAAKGTVPSGDAIDQFYFLARTVLVKDESHYDRFDRVFAAHFKGAEQAIEALLAAEIPADWLRRSLELQLSDEEKAKIQAQGGWDALMETLRKRLEEQRARHQGGSKWIGTGGTSPFGADGYNPEGVRIGQEGSRNRRAVKIWDRREFANLDDAVELGTRNVKLALRRLRRFARQGAAEQFDLDATIDSTARRAGLLDIRMVPERHNAVKVLLFLDIGGSMDDHVRICEELFSAARGEFKHLEYFYFHNFVYESVWKDNRRRHTERTPLPEVMRTYGHDYKLVVVGDATMSPYEIVQPGGSIEHWNEEAGAVWMKRLLANYPHHVWLNPEPRERWQYTPSVQITRELFEERMFPLTLEGLDRAMRDLQ
ncbi:MAG: VWA domain-containing protein [Steroidobacteraceae bacterium]